MARADSRAGLVYKALEMLDGEYGRLVIFNTALSQVIMN